MDERNIMGCRQSGEKECISKTKNTHYITEKVNTK